MVLFRSRSYWDRLKWVDLRPIYIHSVLRSHEDLFTLTPSNKRVSWLFTIIIFSIRIGSCLARVYRVMDTRGKSREYKRSVRVTSWAALASWVLSKFSSDHISEKNACLLIINLILVTRGTEKQTLLLAGYKQQKFAYLFVNDQWKLSRNPKKGPRNVRKYRKNRTSNKDFSW